MSPESEADISCQSLWQRGWSRAFSPALQAGHSLPSLVSSFLEKQAGEQGEGEEVEKDQLLAPDASLGQSFTTLPGTRAPHPEASAAHRPVREGYNRRSRRESRHCLRSPSNPSLRETELPYMLDTGQTHSLILLADVVFSQLDVQSHHHYSYYYCHHHYRHQFNVNNNLLLDSRTCTESYAQTEAKRYKLCNLLLS